MKNPSDNVDEPGSRAATGWRGQRPQTPQHADGDDHTGPIGNSVSEHDREQLELRRVARLQLLFGSVDLPGTVLEVGPSHNPLAPKRLGYDTTIVDHADAESLRRKYAKSGVDLGRIEPVDVVWTGQPISELVGGRQFDWVIASHVGEHAPDLIGFLNDYGAVVGPGGRFGLILPDKRFCFDVGRPTSSLARVVDAHLAEHVRPSPGAVVEHFMYASSMNGQISWVGEPIAEFTRVHTDEEARNLLDRAQTDEYLDVHVWCFEPSEFEDLLDRLARLGLLTTMVDRVSDGPMGEFYVTLTRPG